MPRIRPGDRFDDLVRAASRAIVAAGGLRRMQMSEVARAMGVAKGTLYLLVESKEALFDVVLRHGDDPGRIAIPDVLPVPTPAAGATLAFLGERLSEHGRFVMLDEALSGTGADDAVAELRAVLAGVYDVLAANRVAIRILNISARELPELAGFWFDQARGPLHERLTALIARGIARGGLRSVPDASIAARMFIESTMWFAVHRPWDVRPDSVTDAQVRATVIDMLVGSLTPHTLESPHA